MAERFNTDDVRSGEELKRALSPFLVFDPIENENCQIAKIVPNDSQSRQFSSAGISSHWKRKSSIYEIVPNGTETVHFVRTIGNGFQELAVLYFVRTKSYTVESCNPNFGLSSSLLDFIIHALHDCTLFACYRTYLVFCNKC